MLRRTISSSRPRCLTSRSRGTKKASVCSSSTTSSASRPSSGSPAPRPPLGKHIVGVEFAKERQGEHGESRGTMKLYVDDKVMAEAPFRTMTGRYSLCGEGLCIGYDGGDAVSSEYKPKFPFSGGRVIKVVYDIGADAYVDVERGLAAVMARD